jgi:hypothetical protein
LTVSNFLGSGKRHFDRMLLASEIHISEKDGKEEGFGEYLPL